MSLISLKAVHSARLTAQTELRNLYDLSSGPLSGEARQTEARLIDEIRGLTERETNLINLADHETRSDAAYRASGLSSVQPTPAFGAAVGLDSELRALVGGDTNSIELRAVNTATVSEGAETVPELIWPEVVVSALAKTTPALVGAKVLVTETGADLRIPRIVGQSTATKTAEGDPIPESDPVFDSVTLASFKHSVLMDVTNEAGTDGVAVLRDVLMGQMLEACYRSIGADYATAVAAAPSGKTASATDAVTGNELIDLQHSVIAQYRANGTWLMNDATLAEIRKLKDNDGAYLWNPGLIPGVPDTLLGRPVVTGPDIALMAAGNSSVVFGDFEAGSVIRYVGNPRLESSDAYKFGNDIVTYRCIVRSDSTVTDTAALRTLTMAAS